MSESISFGTWLRQQRRSRDLTQKTLAQQIGCAEITVRRMEADEYKPSSELADVLFEKLGISESERPQWVRFARGLAEYPDHHTNPTSTHERNTNLPASLTSFIGREKEQAEVINLISKNRLVTLAGVGGIGKTRLSQQVGQKLLDNYPDGVWFIPLDSLSNAELVPQTVAAIFEIRESASDKPIIERLTFALRAKTMLLILDNCEHLLDACAQLITTLLQHCAHLKILVTSREVLKVEGEAIDYLPVLSTPDADTIFEALVNYEAIRLFAERAALPQSSFRLTTENATAILNICRRVDGLPLAIELAAARVDTLQVQEILNQLQHRFDLLVSDKRGTIPRHQALQASMDWSWGLLSEAEQNFMQQLSIFAGGWTLEAGQAVCDGDVLSLTNALVKKSLIIADQRSGHETRYRFHEIVHQYAYQKLVESDE